MSKIRDGLFGLYAAEILGTQAAGRSREELGKNPVTGLDGRHVHTLDIREQFRDLGAAVLPQNDHAALKRVLPDIFKLYSQYGIDITRSSQAMEQLHGTVRHRLSMSACGIYAAIAARLMGGQSLRAAIRDGVKNALSWYEQHPGFENVADSWKRITKSVRFAREPEENVSSRNPVEAALWCLLNTDNYAACVLKAVNLGGDPDCTAAIAGSLAGMYYGYDTIPEAWLQPPVGMSMINICCNDLERYCHDHNQFAFRYAYQTIRNAKAEGAGSPFRTGSTLNCLPMKKNLNKFRGCLIGGAAGDALGFAVEFAGESSIFGTYGERGITEYTLVNSLARISDDTQMTLFTANALLYGTAKSNGIVSAYPGHISKAYREWQRTQTEGYPLPENSAFCSWLMNVPDLFVRRAPGNTCMQAIFAGASGTIEKPINFSKGCGGVMRVAPVGLYFGESDMEPVAIDLLGADAASLTHGHELGYIPAAMLVHIVRLVSHNDEITLKEAVLDAKEAMEKLFVSATHLPDFLKLIDKAVSLSESDTDDLTAIHTLGEGWVGDEALAIAIYCALRHEHDFEKALIASVNHGGDSDSTGAITGNILGAYLGLDAISKKFTDKLELLDVLTEIADDLYYDFRPGDPGELSKLRETDWYRKYVDITYRKE